LIEMAEQGVSVVVHNYLARGDMRVDLSFTFLPALCPKPSLIGGYGQGRAQLKDTVVTFGDLHLCARLIQMQSAPNFGRQCHNAAGLHSHVPMKGHMTSIPYRP
jgi:hypothetical protein